MALTPSNMLDLGTQAPEFRLPDVVSHDMISLDYLDKAPASLIMFICNHCPYVIHVHDELLRLQNDYLPKGVKMIAISSNDVENYPDDSPEKMKLLATDLGFKFPYLFDESQEVARAYDAACTPDFYLFDENKTLVYRGRLDGSRPGNDIPLTGEDLRNAIDQVLDGNTVGSEQMPSMGCNIKWKRKN